MEGERRGISSKEVLGETGLAKVGRKKGGGHQGRLPFHKERPEGEMQINTQLPRALSPRFRSETLQELLTFR